MLRIGIIFCVGAAGSTAAYLMPLERLIATSQAMLVALSVLAAAVLVRLNRGMPSLEWKSIPYARRSVLTQAVLDLNRDYARILALVAGLIVLLVCLTAVGHEALGTLPKWLAKALSGLISAGLVLGILRMGYVVWRDVDIVRLQKIAIDAIADQDANAEQAKLAEEKIVAIRSAGVRKNPLPEPKAWNED